MTQITINVQDKNLVSHLKKILSAIDGVTIASTVRSKKSGIEEAYDDIRNGRVYHAENVDSLFKDVLGI